MKYEFTTEEVYELVADAPDGLSTREVAEELSVPFTAAKNHCVHLHINGKIESTTPRYTYESAKWVVTDG